MRIEGRVSRGENHSSFDSRQASLRLDFSYFQRLHFAQAPQVSFSLAEVTGKERLYQVPGDGWSHGPAAHAKNVHVIVLDTLPRREMIMDQRSSNTSNF